MILFIMRQPLSITPPSPSDTASRILDIAERLVQTRGFNGFSYADIAVEVGISKASLHHHFATKAELGHSLIRRYAENFRAMLATIDTTAVGASAKLKRYIKVYETVLANERMCLCGMLAAEYSTLHKAIQDEIRRFFDLNERWLAGVIEQGRGAKFFHSRGSARDTARMLLNVLEGSMLVARSYNDPRRFTAATRQALTNLKASRGPVGRKQYKTNQKNVSRWKRHGE